MANFKRILVVASFIVMGLAELALLLAASLPAHASSGVIYVNVHAAGSTHNGASWATAFITLQGGLNAAATGSEVWVAQGVYTPTQGVTRTKTFALKSGVALYGGFAATETLRIQRNWVTHITVLSGDLDGNDHADAHGVVTATANITGSNAYHVVSVSGLNAASQMDGFTLTAGSADTHSYPDSSGGGVLNQNGNGGYLTLQNVTVSGDYAASDGGGMYEGLTNTTTISNVVFIGNSAYDEGGGLATFGSPTLSSVTFQGNHAGLDGGGMYSKMSHAILNNVTFYANSSFSVGGGALFDASSNAVMTNVSFISNSSSDGGGLFNDASSPTMTNVIFNGNSADGFGGGLNNSSGSNPRLINALFSGNSANAGGGLCNFASSPSLVNATLSGNYAIYKGYSFTGNGGAMYNAYTSTPTLVNSIMWGDSAVISGAEIYNDDTGSTVSITYGDVQRAGGYPGAGNINANPQFVAPITYTAAPTTAGNYRLQHGSPAIDAGHNASVTVSTDLDRRPRIVGSKVDMGAYELAMQAFLPLAMRSGP